MDAGVESGVVREYRHLLRTASTDWQETAHRHALLALGPTVRLRVLHELRARLRAGIDLWDGIDPVPRPEPELPRDLHQRWHSQRATPGAEGVLAAFSPMPVPWREGPPPERARAATASAGGGLFRWQAARPTVVA